MGAREEEVWDDTAVVPPINVPPINDAFSYFCPAERMQEEPARPLS
jgi:hypothetical protein